MLWAIRQGAISGPPDISGPQVRFLDVTGIKSKGVLTYAVYGAWTRRVHRLEAPITYLVGYDSIRGYQTMGSRYFGSTLLT
jgi:hypothetical protein